MCLVRLCYIYEMCGSNGDDDKCKGRNMYPVSGQLESRERCCLMCNQSTIARDHECVTWRMAGALLVVEFTSRAKRPSAQPTHSHFFLTFHFFFKACCRIGKVGGGETKNCCSRRNFLPHTIPCMCMDFNILLLIAPSSIY